MRNWTTTLVVGLVAMGVAGPASAAFHMIQKHPAPRPCMGLGRNCVSADAADGTEEMKPLDEETVHYIGY